MALSTIPKDSIAADAIDATKIADDAISEEHLDPTAITASTEKSTLVAADKFLIADSAASNAIKYVQQSNLGSGTHVKLLSGSASSAANHDFQNFMDTSKYNSYMVQFSEVIGLQSNTLDFQFVADTTVLTNSNYWFAYHGHRSTANEIVNYGESQAQASLGSAMVASSGNAANYMFYIYNNPNSTNMGNNLHGHNWGYRSDLGDYLYTEFTCGFNNSHNVTGFRVHAQGNDNSTFDYAIYGIAK